MFARPKVALALGGGGARGIAHVLALEAGRKWAFVRWRRYVHVRHYWQRLRSGMEGRAIRAHIPHILGVLRDRSNVMSKLLRARVGRFSDLVLRGRGNPVLLDPEICLDLFWPAEMPDRFEDLAINTVVVATDYLDRNEVAYDAGPLRPPVAGSAAIPGLFRPVLFGDEVLIDGGAVNPSP
jgi:NTE family protein